MENMRTVAFQVPESLFQRIKDYLQRNNMTQRQFLLGLIEAELDRDLTEREAAVQAVSDDQEQEDKVQGEDEETACEGEADEEFAPESDDQRRLPRRRTICRSPRKVLLLFRSSLLTSRTRNLSFWSALPAAASPPHCV